MVSTNYLKQVASQNIQHCFIWGPKNVTPQIHIKLRFEIEDNEFFHSLIFLETKALDFTCATIFIIRTFRNTISCLHCVWAIGIGLVIDPLLTTSLNHALGEALAFKLTSISWANPNL